MARERISFSTDPETVRRIDALRRNMGAASGLERVPLSGVINRLLALGFEKAEAPGRARPAEQSN